MACQKRVVVEVDEGLVVLRFGWAHRRGGDTVLDDPGKEDRRRKAQPPGGHRDSPATADRRNELVKVAHKYAEAAKVAVRHVRRDGLDTVKKLEKNREISEDDQERLANDVQKATDAMITEIDPLLAAKEKEILTVCRPEADTPASRLAIENNLAIKT